MVDFIESSTTLNFFILKYFLPSEASNILFDHGIDPDPKLTDFAQGYLGGLEQINPSESLFYSHPDQLKGEDHSINNNGIRWDIYSFGAVFINF